MNISIFDVLGPVMIGPSSSHTAGAAKLSEAARLIAKGQISHISFGLHGSFSQTYKGHGTDRALVAGALGLDADDEQLADSFELAAKNGLGFDFYETELENVHENTVKMTLTMNDGSTSEIVGSSIGGGQIMITQIEKEIIEKLTKRYDVMYRSAHKALDKPQQTAGNLSCIDELYGTCM